MRFIKIGFVILLCLFLSYKVATQVDFNNTHEIGEALDSLDNVTVYYNGAVNHVKDRNLTADNYNLGLRYQCVEFVKRYYYEHYNHKMPNSYGHAKHFFNTKLAQGAFNTERGLYQFYNHGNTKPQKGDLVVFSPHIMNPYGHVAIISKVDNKTVEIIQQNPGPFSSSRETFKLWQQEGLWHVESKHLLGWLRLKY